MAVAACSGSDPVPYRAIPIVPAAGAAAPAAGSSTTSTAGRTGTAGTAAPMAGHPDPAETAGIGPAAGSGGSPGTGGAVSLPAFDAGSDPDRNKVQPGSICGRLAAIDCAGEQHCCQNPGRTLETCKSDLAATCTDMLYFDRIAGDPITGFDAAAAQRAFDELEGKASQCDPSVAVWVSSADGLRGILKGTRPAGATCTPTSLSDNGSIGAALASCADSTTQACLFESALGDWTCQPKNGAGGNCITDDNCSQGLYCDNPNMAPLGTCSARRALGASCTDDAQCSSTFCAQGACVAADVQLAYCLKE